MLVARVALSQGVFMQSTSALVALAAATALASPALAQQCMIVQAAPFAASSGVNGPASAALTVTRIYAAIVHDFDGPDPLPEHLIVSGSFLQAGGMATNGIAAFDGERWHPLGRGLNLTSGAPATASNGFHGGVDMVVLNNELYVGGVFNRPWDSVPFNAGANGLAYAYLARWNGMTWEPLHTATTINDLSGGEIWDLEVFRGEVYFAGQNMRLTFGGSGADFDGIGVLRRTGPQRMETYEGPGDAVFGLTTFGDELLYARDFQARAWNGSSARTLPPASDNSLNPAEAFPTAGIDVAGGVLLGGASGLFVPNTGLAATAIFNGEQYRALRGLPTFSGATGAPRRIVWRFTRMNEVVRAWTVPLNTSNPAAFVLQGDEWIRETYVPAALDSYLRGDITFQGKRYIYGNSIQQQSTFSPLTTPMNNISAVGPANTLVAMTGVYPMEQSQAFDQFPQRPVTKLGTDIVYGGPYQFVHEGQISNFVAKWNGTRWDAVASNALVRPPSELFAFNGTLYAIGRLTEGVTQLLRLDAGVWAAVTTPSNAALSTQTRLEQHNNELWLVNATATGGGSLLYRITPGGADAVSSTGLPASLTSPRLISTGSALYLRTSTNLYRLDGTSWTNIPLTGGPVNVLNTAVINGSLHAVSPAVASPASSLRVHRLDGNTWTLLSTGPADIFRVSGVSEVDGDLHVAAAMSPTATPTNAVALATLDLETGTWSTYTAPTTNFTSTVYVSPYGTSGDGTNLDARVIKDAAGRTLMFGPFRSVGVVNTAGIAMLAPAEITVHWPPFARTGAVGDTISIGVGATSSARHDGDITYQWFRGDQALTNGTTSAGTIMSGVTTKRLQLRSARVADSGMYSVRMSLACGTSVTTSPVAITISTCNDIDFNNDGVMPDDQDVIAFFEVLAGAACFTCDDIDFNNNSVFPEEQDTIDFLHVLAGGSCD